jgi:hypothetical protein
VPLDGDIVLVDLVAHLVGVELQRDVVEAHRLRLCFFECF